MKNYQFENFSLLNTLIYVTGYSFDPRIPNNGTPEDRLKATIDKTTVVYNTVQAEMSKVMIFLGIFLIFFKVSTSATSRNSTLFGQNAIDNFCF
jgi:hypothetical protein